MTGERRKGREPGGRDAGLRRRYPQVVGEAVDLGAQRPGEASARPAPPPTVVRTGGVAVIGPSPRRRPRPSGASWPPLVGRRRRYFPPHSHDATAATRQAAIANPNATTRPSWNGWEISDGKKPAAGEVGASAAAGGGSPWGRAATGSGCSRAARRTGPRPAAARRPAAPAPAGTPWAVRPGCIVVGSEADEPGDHQREEDADREHHRGVLERRAHARRRRRAGRRAGEFMIAARLGEANRPIPKPLSSRAAANSQ